LVSPEYSARKHHVPAAFGVNAAEVAAPPLNVTAALPTGVPLLAQPLALVSGPQAKKLTDPVGTPPVPLPATVALSVFEPPRTNVDGVGVLAVTDDAFVTVKHSLLLPSDDAA
jgi:hypothetical protein